MTIKITKEMRHLVEDMIRAEKSRYNAPKRMSDVRAFRRAYDIWYRHVS